MTILDAVVPPLVALVSLVASAPAVAVAIYYLSDGGPRALRPWHVSKGTRKRLGQPVFLFWILSPIWLYFIIALPMLLQTGNSGLATAWGVVAVGVGWFASWIYRAYWVGVSIGLATFTVPLLWIALPRSWSLGLLAEILAAPLIWNVWVIATIMIAESAGLRSGPNTCRRCGYDISGPPSAAPCPECGNAGAVHG